MYAMPVVAPAERQVPEARVRRVILLPEPAITPETSTTPAPTTNQPMTEERLVSLATFLQHFVFEACNQLIWISPCYRQCGSAWERGLPLHHQPSHQP